MFSSAVSAAFFQLFHTVGLAYVPPGIFTLISFQADKYIFVILGVVLAFGLAAVLTYLFGMKEEKAKALEDTERIVSPLNGKVIAMTEMKDEVFRSEAMGTGVAVIPEEGKVYAPCDGEVAMVFPTGHAIGLTSENGTEILIHIGVNTVEENGNGFEVKVQQDAKVKKGDLLVTFDLEMLRKKYDMTTPVIITNTDDFKGIKKNLAEHADNDTVVLELER